MLGEIPAGVPVLRDAAKAWFSGRTYEMSPVGKIADSVGTLLFKDAPAALGLTDQDLSDKWVKHAIETPGYVFGLPTGQLGNTVQYLWDYGEGNTEPDTFLDFLRGLAFGTPRQ